MKRYTSSLLLAFGLILMAAGCSKDPLSTEWYEIEQEHRPYLRWWWLGSAVDREGLTYNLEEFAAKGFGGVEITPIYGVQGNEANDLEYLSPEWLEMLRHAQAEGKRLGVAIDMNNGTGWPFGGPQITEEHAAQKFFIERYPITAEGGEMTLPLAVSDPKQASVAELVAVQAVKGEERIDLMAQASEQTLRWTPPTAGRWTIYALFSGRTFQKVKRAAPGGAGLVMNHYDRAALDHYLDRFEEAFSASNTELPKVLFNDSYEVYGASWDAKLPAAFEAQHGYRLTDYLPELAGEGRADTRARVVSDYRETLAALLLENFTEPWTEWAHRHGALTRNQAHGSPGNIIDIYAAVDIPECESYGRSEFDLPGLRHDSIRKPNDGTPAVLKFASSAAHLTGKKSVSAEALTWLTEHFRTSIAQCKPEIDQMFASGVNHLVFHGAPYSPKGAEFPAWRFYAAINMSPTAALWPDIEPLTTYIARCQSFLTAGEPDNDLLLYLPQYDIWHEQQGNPYLTFDIHKMDRTMPHIKRLMDEIVARGYDADYLSDRFLQSLRVKDGVLISEGGARYKALLIPSCRKMPLETLEKILELTRKGATVFFTGHYPEDLPGLGRLDQRERFRALLKELPRRARFTVAEPFTLGRGRIFTGEKFHHCCILADIYPESFKKEWGGTMIRRKNEVGGYNYFLAMLQNRQVNGWVELITDAESVVLFDPMTGRRGLAQLQRNERGRLCVRLQLKPGESILMKTFDHKVEVEPWLYVNRTGKKQRLDRGWSISFPESTPAIEQRFATDTLCDWTKLPDPRAQINRGVGRYEVRFTLDDPAKADEWLLDLGDVRESAVVWVNGHKAATCTTLPFEAYIGEWLVAGENLLQIDVRNLPSNAIAEMERQGVQWRIFKDANIASVTGQKRFSFGDWPTDPAGLNSAVTLIPIHIHE